MALTTPTIDDAAPVLAPPADRRLTPRQARLRSFAERLVYAGLGITTWLGPHAGNLWLNAAAVATGALTCRWLWKRTEDHHHELLVACYKATPIIGFSGLYTAALLQPGAPWWEMAATGLWTAAVAWWAPATRSRGVRRHIAAVEQYEQPAALPAELDQAAPTEPTTYAEALQAYWAASPLTEGTELIDIVQLNPAAHDFQGVIVAEPGHAVPLSLAGSSGPRTIAAIFNVPEDAVALASIPGYGPGYLAVRVAPNLVAAGAEDLTTLQGRWAAKVSAPGGVAPGMELTDHQVSADGNATMLHVVAPEGELLKLPHREVARALNRDRDLVMIEATDAEAVVTVYETHPLIDIREATVEDLTMDENGLITIGLTHDGRAYEVPLFIPGFGAVTGFAVGAPGAGKSVYLLTLMAAERISGVVSIALDTQNGMSFPDARGRVYHFGGGQAEVYAGLKAACALADYREQISTANGWSSFAINRPWPLVNVTWDEINLALRGNEPELFEGYRNEVSGFTGKLQSTGRKFGVGERIAGQSIHVSDLNDCEFIRAGAKNGPGWMGRLNSSRAASMATDAIVATGDNTEITPIPVRFGDNAVGRIAAAWSKTKVAPGPVTSGMAWSILNQRKDLMRVFRADKDEDTQTYPHLIALMESKPMPVLTPAEHQVFQAAHAEALEYLREQIEGVDQDDDEEEGGGRKRKARKRPHSTASHPAARTTATAASGSLREQVLAFLVAEPLMCTVEEIRAAVGADTDDGPRGKSVSNVLTQLSDDGLIQSAGRGRWMAALTDPTN